MRVIRNITELKSELRNLERSGKTIGFVPTMGYLHQGHTSLLDRSNYENDISVLSIFVNPTQFGANEDLSKYPRDEKRDLELAKTHNVDFVFIPDVEEMYSSYLTTVHVKELTSGLCGKSRPTHFDGVTTVVTKLFNIVRPTKAYFGQKDIQQLQVIRRMVSDLDMDVVIVGCEIVRESDGLALSSRNVYLTKEQRVQALSLSNSLREAKLLVESGVKDTKKIKSLINDIISKNQEARIDYIEVVDFETLKDIDLIENRAIVLLAVFVGKTRLIDNIILEEEIC